MESSWCCCDHRSTLLPADAYVNRRGYAILADSPSLLHPSALPENQLQRGGAAEQSERMQMESAKIASVSEHPLEQKLFSKGKGTNYMSKYMHSTKIRLDFFLFTFTIGNQWNVCSS